MIIKTNPVSKPRQTRADKWKQRPCVMKYRAYADFVRKTAQEAKFKATGAMLMEFTIPMPKSYSKRKRESLMGMPHENKPDIDNLVKALLDALLKEDSGVHTIIAKKVWGDHGMVVIENLKDYAAYAK